MSDVKNKSHPACEDQDERAMRKELRRTVQEYSRVIEMLDATPRLGEPTPKPNEPHTWRERMKQIFKHFKV